MECFNCLAPCSGRFVVINKTKNNMYNACSAACAQECHRTIYIPIVQHKIDFLQEFLKYDLEKDYKRFTVLQILLYKSYISRKPKAELMRMFDMLKESLNEMLEQDFETGTDGVVKQMSDLMLSSVACNERFMEVFAS